MKDRFVQWAKENGHSLAWVVLLLISFFYYVSLMLSGWSLRTTASDWQTGNLPGIGVSLAWAI